MKQYSFYNTDLLIDGDKVEGFQNGQSIITAAYNSAQHTPILDAYGKLAVSTSADQSGMFSFPLLQTADWNEILYEKAQLTRATGLSGNKSLWTPLQLQLVDKMGDLVATGVNGVILQQPAVVRGSTFTANRWTIFVERLSIVSGQYPSIGN